MGYRGEIVPLDVGDHRYNVPVGWSPWSAPAPFILDTGVAAAIGERSIVGYGDAMPAAVDWLVAQANGDWKARFPVHASYPRDLFDYIGEDAFLAR